jgi:hypothetical protein
MSSEVGDILWEMVEMIHAYDIRGHEASGSDEEWSISDISSDSEEAHDTEGRVCERCNHTHETIVSRGFGWEDYLDLRDMGNGEELICLSCVVGDGSGDDFYCSDCGYSEVLCKQYHGEQLGLFYLEDEVRPDYQDENTRCHGCRARVERWEEIAEIDDRVLFPEEDEEEVIDEWSETYNDELDLAEDEEDNTEEKALRVKATVQEIGEIMFDIKDKITEGEYLKIMDGLQSITNIMNH